MSINRLYDSWSERIQQLFAGLRITQHRNMVWLLVGIYRSKSVHLSKIAGIIPGTAKQASATRRLRRFLASGVIQVRRWYRPIAQHWLQVQAATHGEIRLILDGTKIGASHQLLMIAIAFRRRSLPIAWTWVKHPRGHSTARCQVALLGYVRGLLPEGVPVLVVGDSEFGSVKVLHQLQNWDWKYVLRQKGKNLVHLSQQGAWQPFSQVIQRVGQKLWLGPGKLTARYAYRVNLLAIWQPGEKEPWLLATNLPSLTVALRAYRRRAWIEIVCTQMTKTGVFTTGAGWDDIADFNFFIINDHTINQQFNQLPALFKIQIIQGWLKTLAKLLDVVRQCKSSQFAFGPDAPAVSIVA